jgi:hypothetical protein
MHAVVVKVTLSDVDAGLADLRERVVPEVSKAPGFVAGYWTRKGNTGLSMIIADSEEAAKRGSEMVPGMIPPGVTLESVEIREVVAHA